MCHIFFENNVFVNLFHATPDVDENTGKGLLAEIYEGVSDA